eukprot:GHVU01195689.1.p1 GENE.GHVU01195689.1~~GHVU01195689.1.p1  ORF type:complete len:326 (-),score=67.74 GHVU01195689.1:904-1881(-)
MIPLRRTLAQRGGALRLPPLHGPIAALWRGPLPPLANGPNTVAVRCFGAGDEKIVKARIKSVTSIQKITKAMKMVAASKLKHDQRRLENGLPFSEPLFNLMERLPVETTKTLEPRTSVIAITSDKGLCGGVNTSVARLTRITIRDLEAAGETVSVYSVGDKGRAALNRLFGSRFVRTITEVSKVPPSFTLAAAIAERILLDAPPKLKVVYNHFKTVVSYDTREVDFVTPAVTVVKSGGCAMDVFEFEPERTAVWEDLHAFYLAASLYMTILDSATAEQSARMAAMDNASKNAGEMLHELTLQYNKARQAKITMELIEIISGANAL